MDTRPPDQNPPRVPLTLEQMSSGAAAPVRDGQAAARSAAAPAGTGARGRAGAAARPGISFSGLLAQRPVARDEPTPWRTTVQWIVAAGIACILAYFTYAHDGWVPILSYFDLGVHEFGHLLTFWAPAMLCSLAGSLLQVAAPLGLAVYFWWRRDSFAVILMVAWAGESLNNVSVYIGDAQAMVLTLFGDDGSGAGHDWHNILRDLNLLSSTDAIANAVHVASMVLFIVALGLAVWGFARARRV